MSTDDKVIPLETGYKPDPRYVSQDDVRQLHYTVAELGFEIKELSVTLNKLTKAYVLTDKKLAAILEQLKVKT